MTGLEQATQVAMNKMQLGEINADQANVLIVQIMGVRLITTKLPLAVRKALNEAVKSGELGHIRRDGLKPEAYHHKNGRSRAISERDAYMRSQLEKIKSIVA